MSYRSLTFYGDVVPWGWVRTDNARIFGSGAPATASRDRSKVVVYGG